MTWCVVVRAPLALARGIASSTKPRTHRRCTSHEKDTCTKAVYTNSWQMLHIPRPPLPSRVTLVDNPHPPLAGISRRAIAIASAKTFSLRCRKLF